MTHRMSGSVRMLVVLLAVAGLAGSTGVAQSLPALKPDGQLRLRGEWDGRTAGVGDDAATLSRIRVGVRADVTGWARAYVQLQDSRGWGTEGNTLTDALADRFDLHQGYAELGGVDRVAARLGRQEMALGDERLVGVVGWSNTGRAFDGARVLGAAGTVRWTVFWMNVAERDSLLAIGTDPQANQGEHDDGWLLGGFASTKLGGTTAELTALVDRQALTDEMYTVNLRVHGAAGPFGYEAAGAYQFGPDIRAFFLSGRAGAAIGKVSVAAQADYLSGAEDPAEVTTRAFNTLYATNHKFYGYMDYFLAFPSQLDEAGLVDAMLRGSLPVGRGVTARADLHHFRTARERGGEHTLGTELDLVGSWKPATPVTVEIGGGLFFPRPFASALIPAFGAGDDPTYWGYLQLTLDWP